VIAWSASRTFFASIARSWISRQRPSWGVPRTSDLISSQRIRISSGSGDDEDASCSRSTSAFCPARFSAGFAGCFGSAATAVSRCFSAGPGAGVPEVAMTTMTAPTRTAAPAAEAIRSPFFFGAGGGGAGGGDGVCWAARRPEDLD